MDQELRTTNELPLDFRWRINRSGDILVEGKSFSPDVIIERLSSLLTDDRKEKILQVVNRRTWDVVIAGDQLYDIGNISAVMRTAESFGFLQFKIFEREAAKYKKSDRVSRGSEKWLDLEKTRKPLDCVKGLKKQGYKVYATSLEGKPCEDYDLSQKLVMIMGNEKDGVSPELLEEADACIKLPMCGFTQSYNISVAAALIMQQIYKQRSDSEMNEEEKKALIAQYYLRSVGDSRILQRLEQLSY